MMTELISGILIGIMIHDWSVRLVLPAAVGVLACAQLFFHRVRHPMPTRWERAMRSEGVSEQEIAETRQLFKEASEAPFREIGLIGWKLYTWQFVWSTVTTLPIALVSGLVRDWMN